MKRFRDYSISWKLTLLAVVTCVLVLSGTAIAFFVMDHRITRSEMTGSYSTMADVFGRNCLKSLEISDRAEAGTVLSSIQLDEQIDLACVYDAAGNEFASFHRGFNVVPPLAKVCTFNEVFGRDGYLRIVRPIHRDSRIVGHIYLRVACDKLWRRQQEQMRLSVLVLCVSVFVSIVLAGCLQFAISSPILQLVEMTRRVIVSGDFSLRATKYSKDELGVLVDSFNEMLSVIESRDRELIQHRENLTELVGLRTAELEKKTSEAMAASVAKGDFLANMSHEIRTPLNAIMGYTDLLRRGWNDSAEERDEMLATVHSSGRHLMTVINDILDLSKIESGRVELDPQIESPHDILSEVVSLMRVQFREKNLTLDYNWEGLVPATIQVDGQRLRQILINLVGNAKKFTLNGGVRMIARVEGEPKSAKMIVDVIDSGVGIPEGKHDQIFAPFMQADTSVTRRFGGTGLGLSISRRLARMMGGDLTVKSSPGAGSDFCLSISTGDLTDTKFLSLNAIGDILPTRMSCSSQPMEVPRLDGLRVLLVDDGDSNRKLISLILKRSGATITEACDGKQACEIALGGSTFDVVLLDMQMPVMDGYTAAETMRAAGLSVPIIALTAHAMKDDRDNCMNAGCSDYLTKPVAAEELYGRMQTIYSRNRSETIMVESFESKPIRSSLPIDDPEFAAIVIDFVPILRREVTRLADAVHQRNPVEALAAAHWIKGAAGTAGFGCFTSPAIQITTAIRSNVWTDVDRQMMSVQSFLERIEVPTLEMCTN